MGKKYFAHSKGDNEQDWEPLAQHLENVAEKCEEFANVFECKGFGRIAGQLHDIGKYSAEFQERLKGKNIRVDHSSAGAIEAAELFTSAFAILLQYVITGHHSGLLDFGTQNDEGTVAYRLGKKVNDFSAYREEIKIDASDIALPTKLLQDLQQGNPTAFYGLFFLIKMLFSCLVDADFLETEKFIDLAKNATRGVHPSIEELAEKFESKMVEKELEAKKTEINICRSSILKECKSKAIGATGLFSLTVPTGGGKTLSSMAFALNHAIENHMDRIIYVIPYTSIIEQTAKIFKDIFGSENVLEHHSNFDFQKEFDYENDLYEDIEQKALRIKQAAENWDIPIVVTTNVQFFESIYANKTSRSRKLHNMANAVIILDEAQLLPPSRLRPALECLCELVDRYHSSVVFCTATQPAVDSYLREGMQTKEIVSQTVYNPEVFKRVIYKNIGKLEISDLATLINEQNQALCVVNNKALARKIFELLPKDSRFHLSGYMCPAHRSALLVKIKKRLKEKKPIHVVTTQLIEAGVDIDFPVVFRQMAGIDSIIQAAGRCNREGDLPFGEVFIFEIAEGTSARGFLRRTADIGFETIRMFPESLDSDAAVSSYFKTLYSLEELDKDKVLSEIQRRASKCQFPFRKIAEDFKLIENDTVPIIIPYDNEAIAEIERLQYTGNAAARKLQKYTVNVYGNPNGERARDSSEFQRLMNNGGIRLIADTYYVLNIEKIDEDTFYSPTIGLRIEGNEGIWSE